MISAKHGLLRVSKGGTKIAVEVWTLTPSALVRCVAAIPPPLTIGTFKLADGSHVRGFLVEVIATEGARGVSHFGDGEHV
jgi:allophanate hydrolase